MERWAPVNSLSGFREVTSSEGLRYVGETLLHADSQKKGAQKIEKLWVKAGIGKPDGLVGGTRIKHFFKAIREYPFITKLRLTGADDYTATQMHAIYIQQNKNSSLKELILKDGHFTNEGMNKIAEALYIAAKKNPNNFNIETLDLSHNKSIGSSSMDHLAKYLETQPEKLKELNLSYTNIGAEGIKSLVSALAKVPNLEVLNLESVGLGDEGAEELGKLFEQSNLSIKKLNICDNRITPIGLSKLLPKIASSKAKNFESLDISKNFFGDAGMNNVIEMMGSKKNLIELKMNQCEITIKGFEKFCEKMHQWYSASVEDFHNLQKLEVAKNGLGNKLDVVIEMLKHSQCIIKKLNYGGNAINDSGVRIFANWLKSIKPPKEDEESEPSGNQVAQNVRQQMRTREQNTENKFEELGLKSNVITSDGAALLAEAMGVYKDLKKLDLRKNKIGVSGAVAFKKQFVKRQFKKDELFKPFHLCVLPADVTAAGVNHLAIGMREPPKTVHKIIEDVEKQKKNSDGKSENIAEFKLYFNTQNNRPLYNLKQYDSKDKPVVVSGLNDENFDEMFLVNLSVYSCDLIAADARGTKIWQEFLWGIVKMGYGALVSNTLYRLGLLLSFTKNGNNIADVYREFWDELMYQTTLSSNGMTMFEWCLNHSAKPVIDVVRQFHDIFPRSGPEDVFLEHLISENGMTLREICLECKDPLVLRYASAKELLFGRFWASHDIYRSRFTKILHVEDLFKTEDISDEDRFYYCRKFPSPKQIPLGGTLHANERDAHASFCIKGTLGEYIECDSWNINDLILVSHNATIDGLKDKLLDRDAVALKNNYQRMNNLHPTFTKPYNLSLRDYLDNNNLTGGANVSRVQNIAYMIAFALQQFNQRDPWINRIKNNPARKNVALPEENDLNETNRVHGNVKPRNIVMRAASELPDYNSGADKTPEKWVLTDFSRSVKHGTHYDPVADSAYVAPELARRVFSKDVNVRAEEKCSEKIDVWAFGTVLYELLAGVPLFKMETRDDTLLDDDERAELCNWLGLDEERVEFLKSVGDDDYNQDIIKSGIQLVQMCLQGTPSNRPSFEDIINHPFLVNVNYGKEKQVKEMDKLTGKIDEGLKKWTGNLKLNFNTGWDNEGFLHNQPHVHVVNTGFDEAGVIVKSLEEQYISTGCIVTTDQMNEKVNDEVLKARVQSARIIVVLLTKDAFTKASVIMQLLNAEDYRRKDEKAHSRVVFLKVDDIVSMGTNKWDEADFRDNWWSSDDFQYLVRALAVKNPSFKKIKTSTDNFNKLEDTWFEFLKNQVHGLILTNLVEAVPLYSQDFLAAAAKERILVGGQLMPPSQLNSYEPTAPEGEKNFIDSKNLLKEKLNKKEKAAGLYFLPSKKKQIAKPRVYVLSGSGKLDDTKNFVEQIAQYLESPVTKNKQTVDDDKKVPINKVKTSFNLKKDSHVKYTARGSRYQKLKDTITNTEREPAPLIIVACLDPGFFQRYGEKLSKAIEEKGLEKVIIIPVKHNWNPKGRKEKEEFEKYCPEKLKTFFSDSDHFLPFFKKKDLWQHNAVLDEVADQLVYLLDKPAVVNTFT